MDRAILAALQEDGTLSAAQLGEKVGLSATPCWKRVKAMEEAGLITKRVALVDRAQAGLPVTVFVSLRTNRHDEAWLRKFAASVSSMPEVMEFHRMSGDVDYLLKVVAADIAGYDRFYKRLIQNAQLAGVSSAFSMEEIKSTTVLPL
jgi:Lrp/AsnC family transcriptional regulator